MNENGHARRAETLFGAAMELDAERRSAFLDGACHDNPELRREVDALLRLLDLAQTDQLFPVFRGSAASSLLGQQVGSYRILREIGEGGMGTVYLAEREDVGKRAALKLVRDGRLASPAQLQRFLLERRVLARLEHPNIARLLDAGLTEDGLPYLVMEYVEGTPITEYCDKHCLTVSERLHLYQQVCLAVQHAHRNLVVHRDLKPSNILVTESAGAKAGGEVKLLDFGIAKLLGENESQEPALTRRDAPVLTPEYASPEQVRGEPITTASDVYSLGMVLYELLSGHRPYHARGRTAAEVERVVCDTEPDKPSQAVLRTEAYRLGGRTPHELERAILEKDPGRPSGVVTGAAADIVDAAPRTPDEVGRARTTTPARLCRRLRGDLDTIILKALRKEPERRYATAEQFAADLGRHLVGLPVTARPDTGAYRTRKFIGRHRTGAAAAGFFTLVLVAFSLAMGVQAERTARERDKAEQVSTFLTDLFAAADPTVSRGQTVTARELLDRGAERINNELADQPEVRARMMDVTGRAYFWLGLYDQARPLLEGALALRRQVFDDEHPEVATSLYHLAYLLRMQGDFDAAEPLYREALVLRRRLFRQDHPDVVASLNGLGYVLRGRGDLLQAAALYREALAIGRRILDAPHAELGLALDGLGAALQGQADYAAAVPLHRESLAMFRALYGDDHPNVNIALYNLGNALRYQGDLDAAEATFRDALGVSRRLWGDAHPLLAVDMMGLAAVLRDGGDPTGAEVLFREALAIQRSGLPPELRTASTLVELGRLLRDTGRPREAEPLLREALSVRKRILAAPHWQIAQAESALGAALSELGRYREAEPLLVEGYETLAVRLGPDAPQTGLARAHLTAHRERRSTSGSDSGRPRPGGDTH